MLIPSSLKQFKLDETAENDQIITYTGSKSTYDAACLVPQNRNPD